MSRTKEELFSVIDHTALKAVVTPSEIDRLCQEAIAYHMASVCVPSSYVRYAADRYPGLPICTVIGFPLGNASTQAKCLETSQAVSDGASEIDMVIHIGRVLAGDYAYVEDEIRQVKKACEGRILKVIIETCYLDEAQKIRMCGIVSECGADYIKTSTGFGTGGALLEDVRLMRLHCSSEVKIKAAGGIRTREDLERFLDAGANRIGTSGAIAMLTE